jgi:hypothetical protein
MVLSDPWDKHRAVAYCGYQGDIQEHRMTPITYIFRIALGVMGTDGN